WQCAIAPRRVDDPPSRRLTDRGAALERHRVRVAGLAQSHLDDSAGDDLDSSRQTATVQLVLQPAAVYLIGDLRHERRAAEFCPSGDVGVAVVREEHPQTHLAQLCGTQTVS